MRSSDNGTVKSLIREDFRTTGKVSNIRVSPQKRGHVHVNWKFKKTHKSEP